MNSLALAAVSAGFSLILAMVAALFGGFAPGEAAMLPLGLGALLAATLLVGGLLVLEQSATAAARPLRLDRGGAAG